MTRIQVRRDTSANWTKNNPVLASGEPAYETDTGKFKIGDGSKNYTALPYQGGGSSEPPANMVTTDTDQDITGVKRFLSNRQDLSKPAIKIGSYASGQDTYDGGYITSASGIFEIGSYYATNSKGGFLNINSTANSSIFKITSNNSNINPRLQLGLTNYEGEIYNDIAEGLCLSNRKYDYSGQRSILKIKNDTLTFTKTDGTVVDLLAGGGGSSEPPANMVTTDTNQVITGEKGFTSAIKIMGSTTDNYYGQIIRPDGNTVRIQAQYGNPAGLNIGVSSLTYTDASGIDHNLLSSGATIDDSAASNTSTYSSSKIEKLTNITSSDASISITKSDTGVDIVANKNLVTSYAFPSNRYVDLELGASGTKYTAPADGWVTIAAKKGTELRIDTTGLFAQAPNSDSVTGLFIPVKKAGIFTLLYTNIDMSPKWCRFRFYYAEGS